MTPLGIVLISGGHERAHFALMTATAAAAMGRPVTVFATNAGCRLLLRDAPLEYHEREAQAAARGVAGLATLMAAARELGIRLMACEAGLKLEGIGVGALAEDVEVAGLPTFFAALGAGQVLTL